MTGDELEILRTATKAGVDNLLEPYKDLMGKVFGGVAEEIGGMLKDEVAVRRKIRFLGLLKKLDRAVRDAGFDPRAIPDNIWVPALGAATLEDDETLQEKWANLLANAADPRETNQVQPLFSVILKEFTFREARFLDALYTLRVNNPFPPREFSRYQLLEVYAEAGLSHRKHLTHLSVAELEHGGSVELRRDLENANAAIDILLRNGILRPTSTPNAIDLSDLAADVERARGIPRSLKVEATNTTGYELTVLGLQFVKACQAPSPDSP